MSKRKLFTCFAFALLLWASCTDTSSPKGYPVLKASLKETNTSLFDLFEKVELIPLETTDSSLIKWTSKVRYHAGKYYVFDEAQSALFIFDDRGSYINKIHRIGQGPGEYEHIYDFCLDTICSRIDMLSPWGAVF